jgi:hypothetical protein
MQQGFVGGQSCLPRAGSHYPPDVHLAAGCTLQSPPAGYPVDALDSSPRANSLKVWPAVRLEPVSGAQEEASTSTIGRVSFVLLLAVIATGCANQSSTAVRNPSRSMGLPGGQPEPRVSSRADRLRDLSGHGAPLSQLPERSPTADMPTLQPGPASVQQSSQPSESTEDPDPWAVIDWLLKQTR